MMSIKYFLSQRWKISGKHRIQTNSKLLFSPPQNIGLIEWAILMAYQLVSGYYLVQRGQIIDSNDIKYSYQILISF